MNRAPNRSALGAILARSFVSALLSIAGGAVIYVTLGVTMISAILFVLVCGLASLIASSIS
jgi:hypothetical protein